MGAWRRLPARSRCIAHNSGLAGFMPLTAPHRPLLLSAMCVISCPRLECPRSSGFRLTGVSRPAGSLPGATPVAARRSRASFGATRQLD